MLADLKNVHDSVNFLLLKSFLEVGKMNRDTKKYAHGLSRVWVHMSFKVRHCHKIFAFAEVREECKKIILEAAQELGVDIKSIGFDENHLHIIPDLEKYSEPELRKTFKGGSGYFLLKKFPWMKHKYFWGSGLWGSKYYCYSIGSDMHVLDRYIAKQKYFMMPDNTRQMSLMEVDTLGL